MGETALNRLSELVAGAFALQLEAFQHMATLPHGVIAALLVVLLAGLSLAIGQAIILFINQVKPLRFCFSLLLNAVLFTFGFLFLVLSTWIICLVPWSVQVPFWELVKVLGLAYAPFLFSFLGALPYFGNRILNLLSGWNLLAMVVGFSAITEATLGAAFGYVIIGWVVQQLLENTIGQPISKFGKAIADYVAGVDLADNQAELAERSILKFGQLSSPIVGAMPQSSLPELRQLIRSASSTTAEAAQTVAEAVTQAVANSSLMPSPVISSRDPNPLVKLEQRSRPIPSSIKLLLSLTGMVLLFVIVAGLMRPIREHVFTWHDNLPTLFQFTFDLFWIGIVAIVFAGLLAPLETMGWWAGWYGDEVSTVAMSIDPAPETLPEPKSRYVIYLDGIGQSGDAYTPDVEGFLAALKPALPPDVELVQGLMMYSVLNKPLDEDRPLAFIWRLADKLRWDNPTALLGLMLNLRNVFIVAVSADRRYGPIYNQGIAQVLYNGLMARGYQPGTPITLIGYSGGGEMSVAAGPYLKRATGAAIEVISVGGVMSANNDFLRLEHLYHLVGDKDGVERVGPIMFPRRWKVFWLSYWNRAKRCGKITISSLGPVGHQVPGGYMDANATLPDGRTYLQQTIEVVLKILQGDWLVAEPATPRKTSNYAIYQQAEFVHPDYYPVQQTIDLNLYRPVADWIGRLILPASNQRQQVRGALFEVHHAPPDYAHLIGQVVNLRWSTTSLAYRWVKAVTKDVHFSAAADYSSKYGGLVHPDRLNHWKQVDPLESLAGSHPVDDVIVKLVEAVTVAESEHSRPSLYIRSQPVQISGRFYGLVKFLQPFAGSDRFQVVHFNKNSRQFDGLEEVVRLPEVCLAVAYGSYPAVNQDIEKSPLNETGWYIYGAKDAQGTFVVQSLGPRALFRLQPDRVTFGRRAAYAYIRKQAWANVVAQKGRISSVLCAPQSDSTSSIQAAISDWQEGDRALVLHTYGGIGGNKKEPAAATPLFFGHFAYGVAEVVRDPLTDELKFDIRYHQVYSHNTDGLIAGTLDWSRYLGDRQFGWLGTRPVCDILIKLDFFTGYYDFNGESVTPLNTMLAQLQVMTARYRIGDGTGGTYVGAANNCSQDSNQALFTSLRKTRDYLRAHPEVLQALRGESPQQTQRFDRLIRLEQDLRRKLQPLGGLRSDWENNEFNLGCTLEDYPLRNLWTGLISWRTLLPRLASDTIVHTFLKHGATVWVLRTNQIGGYDPDIEPIAPMTL